MRLSAVKRVFPLRPILLLDLVMGMIRGHDHRPQSSGDLAGMAIGRQPLP
jgi:hypothetical protein